MLLVPVSFASLLQLIVDDLFIETTHRFAALVTEYMMGKDNTTATSTGAPEIITKTRTKSFGNPLKSFRERRKSKAAEAANAPTATDTADRTPLVLTTSESMSATTTHEQDTFISMMRATRGMNPEEIKAFLDRKAQVDHEKHKNDVSGLSDGGNMVWMRKEGQVAWGRKDFGSPQSRLD